MSNLPPKYNIFTNLNITGFSYSYIPIKSIDDCFDRYIDYYSKNQQFIGLENYLSKIVTIPQGKSEAGFLLEMEIEFRNMLTRDFLLFSANTLENFIKKIICFFDKNSLYPNFDRSSVGNFMIDLKQSISSNDIALELNFIHESDIKTYRDNSQALRQTRNNIMHDDYLLISNTFMNLNCNEILEYFVKSMIYLQCVIKYIECKNTIKFQ